MTRAVLYSPGFGAGWVSWHHGSAESLRFMMEYAPFVDAVRKRTNRPDAVRGVDLPADIRAALARARAQIKGWDCSRPDEDDRYVEVPVDLLPLFAAFVDEWVRRFPGADLPYTGGLSKLEVEDVPDNCRVRITEYDGSESVEIEGSQEGWL